MPRTPSGSSPTASRLPGYPSAIARAAYILIVLVATLRGLHFDPSWHDVPYRFARALDLRFRLGDVIDGVRNLALFGGLGAVWAITAAWTPASDDKWRVVVRATLLGGALGLLAETLQLFSPARESSIIDVCTNAIGALFGAALVIAVVVWADGLRTRRSFLGVPAVTFALTYGVAVCMETFTPLTRLTLLQNLGGGPLTRIARAVSVVRWSSVTDIPLTDIVLFLPAGVFAVAALVETNVGYGTAATWTCIAGALLSLIIEIVHGVVERPIQIGAILSHTLAIGAGAILAATLLYDFAAKRSTATRARDLLIAYVVAIMVWSWRPFTLRLDGGAIHAQLSARHWTPLAELADQFDLVSVTEVVTQFVLYLPLGALLAVWPLRRRGWWRSVVPAVCLAIVMEAGQLFIAGRSLDITDVLIQVAGAAIGWAVMRRSGYTELGELCNTNPSSVDSVPTITPLA